MRIKSLLTLASIIFSFVAMLQITRAHRTYQKALNTADEFEQSTINKSSSKQKQSNSPSVVPTEKAKMGMYNAVMSALSAGSGLTTRSREHAEKALSLLESPITDIEFYARGIAYTQLKNDDLAIANFTKAIALNPRRYISYLSRGLAYRGKELYDRAIADFDKAIQLEFNMRSLDAEQRKDDFHERYEKASGDFHKLVQLDPEPWFYWFGRGAAYDKRGKAYVEKQDYDRAIADFTMFIQLNPDQADAYDHRGVAYGRKGDLDRAIADFDRAIQLKPQMTSAYDHRGVAYAAKGDLDRAIADFDRAILLDPLMAYAYDDRGAAYGRKGDLDRAIADYEKALQLDPELQSAKDHLAFAYKQKASQDRDPANSDKKDQPFQTDTLASEAHSKAYDDKQVPLASVTTSGKPSPGTKNEVDRELEDAAKRGEKVLSICLQDCEQSSSESTAGMEKGHALKLPKPAYPDSARLEHASGSVEVKVLINEEGKVIAADAISGHPLLREVCVQAAREALFTPTQIAGSPVKVTGVIRYNFLER